MICTSTGIGVLPCFIGDSSKELVRILPDDVEITRNFWMVIHRDVRHLAWVDAFVRWLDAIVNDERALLMGHANVEQARNRSEEHTSELQSLMRISYAVFCLKKKKTQTNENHT